MIPDRIRIAVERLAIRPSDHVLEIGCGNGLAAHEIVQRLTTGSFIAVDRSATAVGHATRRLADAITAGRASVVCATLASLPNSEPALPKVDVLFAIRVNAFWTTAAREELAAVRAMLAEGGRAELFFDAPDRSRLDDIARRVEEAACAAGFSATRDYVGDVLHVTLTLAS